MPDVASSLTDVERRVQRFFTPNTVRIREFDEIVLKKLSAIGPVYAIGGCVRDLAFFGAAERPISDFDLVVNGKPDAVNDFAKSIGANKNRFGGFGIKTKSLKVDFWAFNSTWAKVEKKAAIFKPEDLIKSTFFDWDAIVYNFNSKKIVAIDNYITRLNSRIIDVNLMDTPSAHGNLVRALRRLVMFDGKPGRKLHRFLAVELGNHSWKSIVDAEASAFHVQYLNQYSSRFDFYARFLTSRHKSVAGVNDRRQLMLPMRL